MNPRILVFELDSYSSFYMITTRRLSFENDMVQYRVELNSSLSLSRVRGRVRGRVRVRAEFKFEFESSLSSSRVRAEFELESSWSSSRVGAQAKFEFELEPSLSFAFSSSIQASFFKLASFRARVFEFESSLAELELDSHH